MWVQHLYNETKKKKKKKKEKKIWDNILGCQLSNCGFHS